MSDPPHRVVIVGAGFGGLFAARFLRRAPVEITLIDRTNHHLFQPLLYQVATGILSEGQIAPATRDVLRRHRNVRVELGEVTGFDLAARRRTAVRPDGAVGEHPYDSLIVAAGAGQSYFGHDEFARWAPGMKTLADALDQRARIFGAFEMAEMEDDPEVRRAWLTFAVVAAADRGRDRRADRRAGRRALGATSAASTPRTCGCSCSTVGRTSWPRSVTGWPRWHPGARADGRRDRTFAPTSSTSTPTESM